MPASHTDPEPAAVIDRSSPSPMYDQLRRLILDGIATHSLKPGDLLPGEHRLCEQYGISRTVVRQALGQLENEGIIERVKGKGTFVARPKTSEALMHSLIGLYDDVERRGGHVRSDVLSHERMPAPADVAEALELAPGDPVVVLERLRYVDGEPWSLSTTYMPEAVGALTFGADLRDASLYRLLAEHGVSAASGVRSAEATVATAAQAEMLGIPEGTALLHLRSVSHDHSGAPFEYFTAYHRGDRSRFEFQLRSELVQAALVPTGLSAAG